MKSDSSPISSEKEYKKLLKKVDTLMKIGSEKITNHQAKEIMVLAKSIQIYERKFYTISPPTTLEGMIELKMYEMKLKQVELAIKLGVSNAKLSLILSGKQKPDLLFIKAVHSKLNISADFILQSI